MQEVADAGKDHGQAEAVGGGDDVGIADRAARLNHSGGAGFGGFFDAVGEGKERVGSHDRAGGKIAPSSRRSHGIDAAHLACTEPNVAPSLAKTIALDLTCLETFQAKRKVCISSAVGTRFVTVRSSLRHDFAEVGLLDQDAAQDALEL